MPRRWAVAAGAAAPAAVLLLLAAAEAPRAGPGAPAPAGSVLIEGVPHVKQKPDFCGEACAEMFLKKLGRSDTQDDVFAASGLDPALGRGCHTGELAEGLKRVGFEVGRVWGEVDAARAAEGLEAQFQALLGDLRRGVPSIVCMHYSERPGTTEHFRLILGFDAAAGEVVYHEPAEEGGAYRRMAKERFLALWPLHYDARQWTVIRLPLAARRPDPAMGGGAGAPAVEGAAAARPRFSPADYAQHARSLKERLPGEGFTIVVEPPFVVVGDGTPAGVRRASDGTVRWAVRMLKQDYFEKDPDEILDVFLFRDAQSYERNTRAIFRDRPSTPFGYYSPAHRALIMNIATGGGTLVHEIVHPFVRANFPDCPAWFNEGLGSLYEQCGERDGRIRGFTNWRLPGLQKAIAEGRLPSFERVTGLGDRFYEEDRGTNYAQARYLCYYLQERGLLQRYYREFASHATEDPSGYATLKRVLGEEDMPAFQKRWEEFVTGLKFPDD